MLDKRERINYLWDFYGELLTPRQQEILKLYHYHDLSLGEISSEIGITRQAAHDILKRSEATLEKMEDKLGLYQRFLEQRQELISILELLQEEERKSSGKAKIRESIERIEALLDAKEG